MSHLHRAMDDVIMTAGCRLWARQLRAEGLRYSCVMVLEVLNSLKISHSTGVGVQVEKTGDQVEFNY